MYIVYGKEACPFCVKAKKFLHDEGAEYIYVDLADSPPDLEWLKSLGCRSLPQIFKLDEEGVTLSDDHRIGGFDQLCEHFGSLKQC